MINVMLSGANGKMGKVVADCISQREGIKVVCGVDLNTERYSDFPIYSSAAIAKEKADVIIDFSNPAAIKPLMEYAVETNTPIVAATTGYNDAQIEYIKECAKKTPVFFSFNMSLGVNLLVTLAKKATEILGEQFDIEIVEKHHNQKIDAPSGTAIMLANAINDSMGNSMKYMHDRHSQRKKRDKNEIGMHAVRGGTIVGEHEVIFAGRDEIISLSHKAMSKEIFAVGSISAAEFIKDKPAGLYDMSKMV